MPEPASYYCINPQCQQRQNPENARFCQTCGTPLFIHERYRLISPLRQLHPNYPTEIFEIEDWAIGAADSQMPKIIKILKPTKNPILIRLFQQEARVLTWLRHSGIPKVEPEAYFTLSLKNSKNKLHCLIMEKIEGINLEQWLQSNRQISEEIATNWMQQIGEILALLHKNNIFHRDIKPSNIMLKPDGKLVLIDFGTVREISPTLLKKVETHNITQVISSGYTAPEQIQGQGIPKSDLFALGRTFVHLLTGISPTEMEDPETKFLIGWREYCINISKPLADLIDELIDPAAPNRPPNPQVFLQRIEQLQCLDVTEPQTVKDEIIKDRKYFKFGTAALVFLAGISLWLSAPQMAVFFNDRAADDYNAGKLDSARFNVRLALIFNPNLAESRYTRGLIAETERNFNLARTQYQMAMQSLPDKVLNNLGRLDILEGNYAGAIPHIQKGLQIVKEVEMKSILHKNMGWALLQMGNDKQAKIHLQQAIALKSDRASAYCLLAQVLEAQNNQVEALTAWKSCLKYAANDKHLPEIDRWVAQAHQRLR